MTMMTSKLTSTLLLSTLACLSGALVGCGDSDAEDAQAEEDRRCAQIEAKADECGIANATCLHNATEAQICAIECMIEADCAEIFANSGDFLQCVAVCSGAEPDDFICLDGTGFVKPAGVCDGNFHCQDGSDEASCGDGAAGGPGDR